MSILITGAAGFIGFHLTNSLLKSSEVLALDNLKKDHSIFQQRWDRTKAKKLIRSIHDDFLIDLDTLPETVIHLAAETGIPDSLTNPNVYFKQNVDGTFNVLEQCRKNGIKNLIYASSSSIYSPNQEIMKEGGEVNQQLSFYGTTKRMTELMVENYCRQFGMKAIGLRFFTVYGSWTRPDMAAFKFMTSIQKREPITLYNNGDIYRDFTHVSDIIHAIDLLSKRLPQEEDGFHEVFNIGHGSPASIKKYAELIAENLNLPLKIQSKALPENELPSTHSDTSELKAYIGFQPVVSIEEGVKEMVEWFEAYLQ